MIHDGSLESAGSPNSSRMSGKAGSIRSMDNATIPMQLAISATNSPCDTGCRTRAGTDSR